MSRRRSAKGIASADNSYETQSDVKSSAELCTELAIKDVDMEWSEADYQNLTTYNMFVRMARPQLFSTNPRAHPSKLALILEAKWREFQESNPLNKNDESNDESNSESLTECEDDESGIVARSQSPSERSFEAEDLNKSKGQKGGGLRIKLSLKPLRKSSREHRAHPNKPSLSDKEFEKMLVDGSASESDEGDIKRKKRKKHQSDSEDLSDFATERHSARRKTERKKRKVAADDEYDVVNSSQLNSESEAEDDDESSGSDKKSKKQQQQRPSIPGERKSSRSRKGMPVNMTEMTDREFEKLLRAQDKEKASKKGGHETKSQLSSKSKSDRKGRKSSGRGGSSGESENEGDVSHKTEKDDDSRKGGESGNESDHIWYCELCKDGGNLLLCDTCPKSFHKECLKLEIIPDGQWSCPLCTGEGLPEKGDTSEEDDHETVCRVCGDGGDVILCDSCPLVYHLSCVTPPIKSLPDGDWKCPVCVMQTKPLKSKVKSVLTWRWTHQPKDADELDHTHSPQKQSAVSKAHEDEGEMKHTGQRSKRQERELFVKYEFHSYWDCDWIPELQLQIHQLITYANFKKRFDMNEPPALEDGSSFGRPRHKTGISEDDPHNLEERYYRYGIKPEWLLIKRIIAHDGNGKDRRYLVKWRDLQYADCTWEFAEDVPVGLEDWDKHVDAYWTRRKLKMKEEKETKRFEPPKKVLLRKKLEQQPSYLDDSGGKLHPYQLEGLNWLRFSWSQGTNTILADEMGLGKTIQAITFIYSLWKEGFTNKPFIISAPLSTVPNWEREFELWAPDMYVLTYTGHKEHRLVIRQHEFSYRDGAMSYFHKPCKMKDGYRPKFDVLLTSYEFVSSDYTLFASIDWEVLIIDEAHRLKSNQSLFFRTLSGYKVRYKLLLTGTPLQNNLEELFNLLNFLEPGTFSDMEEFLNEFSEISKDEQVLKLHNMLAPHMLRRMKTDVMKDLPSKSEFIVRVELSPMQKKFYKYILTKNFEALNCKGFGNQTSLINIMMDLRKCCSHPYLFPMAEKEAPIGSFGSYEGNALMKASGKLELLAKMLKVLRRDGHRVLIFSQMTRVLDILEDFLTFHSYAYERIDGNIAGNKRQESIDRFNNPESKQFVFLLSTKAGGLGINLATADTVIIYDMDWNPHNDIQAFSRAHRIGQRNKVMIYRFVSRNTVEEKMTQVCKQKMMLSELIVTRGVTSAGSNATEKKESLTKQEISEILKYGAENLFKDDGEVVYSDEAVEKLLDRTQEGEVEKEKEFGMNEYLRSFKVASYQVKEGVDEEEELVEEEKKDEAAAETVEDDGRKANETDIQYWQRVLGPAYHDHVVETLRKQEEVAKTLGKGKRIRKQINYAEQEMMAAAIENSKKKKAALEERAEQSDYEPSDSDSSEEEGSGGEEEQDSEKAKRKALKAQQQVQPPKPPPIVLPPLVERTDGQVLVLGFTARQRRAFLDAVMRYGMPPEDPYRSQWLVRDLRAKQERVFKAYVSLFMRHLCEPIADTADKFADGVPREGLSRQHVLTRIGVVALIRKKVHEFEDINGIDSMLEFRQSLGGEVSAKEADKSSSLDTVTEDQRSATEKASEIHNPAIAIEKEKDVAESKSDEVAADVENAGVDKSKNDKGDEGVVESKCADEVVADKEDQGVKSADEVVAEKEDQGVKSADEVVAEKEDRVVKSADEVVAEKEDQVVKSADEVVADKEDQGVKSAEEVVADKKDQGVKSAEEVVAEKEDQGVIKSNSDAVLVHEDASSGNTNQKDEDVIKSSGYENAPMNAINQVDEAVGVEEPVSTQTRAGDNHETAMEVCTEGKLVGNAVVIGGDSTNSKAVEVSLDASEKTNDKLEIEVSESVSAMEVDEVKEVDESQISASEPSSSKAVDPVSAERIDDINASVSSIDEMEAKAEKETGKTAESSDAIKDKTGNHSKDRGSFTSAADLRRRFYVADGGFTELYHLWQLEEQQMERGKEFETWFRVHDFWLLAGIITHGYRHWQDILADPRFDILNQAFRTDSERARKAAFLNRRFQLLEQALVIEEQLRKSLHETPSLVDRPAGTSTEDDKFKPLDELAQSLKAMAQSNDPRHPKHQKLHKVLTQVAALVNDINDAAYTNMPASLARSYTMAAPRPMMPPRMVQPIPRPVTAIASPAGPWPMYRPFATIPQVPRITIVSPTQSPAAPSNQPSTSTPIPAASKSGKSDVICID